MGSARSRKERVPADTIGTAIPLLTVQTIFFLFVSLGPDSIGALTKNAGLTGGFLHFDGPLAATSLVWVFLSVAAFLACMFGLAALLIRQLLADRLVQVSGGLFGVSLTVFVAHLLVLGLVVGPLDLEEVIGYVLLGVVIPVVVFVAYKLAVRMDGNSEVEPTTGDEA